MQADRWAIVKRIFWAAVEVAPEHRTDFVRRECAGSNGLEAEVWGLLRQESAARFLDERPAEAIGLPAATGDDTEAAVLPYQLGRFRLVEVLGTGAHGSVYRAEQDHPRREVALKLVSLPRVGDQVRTRFTREALALARLEHEGIARLYDASGGDGIARSAYIVMELVRGVDIATFVASHRPTTPNLLRLFARVCDAVDYAHSQGVVHRDLKPANILVTADGHPKVLDFGVARLTESSHGPASVTLTRGELLGTVGYMSPEQLLGDGASADARSDVYALGVILHELLSGRPLIDAKGLTVTEAIDRARADPPYPVSMEGTRWSADLRSVVRKCLETTPAARYGSASALACDIRRVLGHEPVLAHRAPVWQRIRKYMRRRRGPMLWSGVGLFGLLVGVAAMVLGERHARNSFAQARDSIGAIVKEMTGSLGPEVGTAASREAVLGTALDRMALFVASRPDDDMAQVEYARVLLALSDVDLQRGRVTEALERRTQAENRLERLAHRGTSGLDLRPEWAASLVRIGDIHKVRGDTAAARSLYQRSHEIGLQVAKERPDDPAAADALVWGYERLADLEARAGNMPEARELAERRLAAARQVARARPGAQSDFGVWVAHVFLAQAYARVGDRDRFAAHVIAGIEIGERLIAAAPQNRDFLRYLALNHVEAAGVAHDRADLVDHLGHLERAVSIAETLYGFDPSDEDARDTLCATRHTLARFLGKQGRPRDALSLLERAAADRRELIVSSPERSERRESLARVLMDGVFVSEQLGREDLARDWATEACSILSALSAQPSPNLEHLCAHASFVLTCPVRDLQDPAEAAVLAQRAVSLSAGRSAVALLLLAEAQLDLGKFEAAETSLSFDPALIHPSDAPLTQKLEELRSRCADGPRSR